MGNKIKGIVVIFVTIFLLSACGSGGSTKSGILIDGIVSGIKYINGTKTGFTDEDGKFPYSGGVVEFYLGNIKIGQIDSLSSDNKVFIQDIVGLDRTNISDEKVLKIATLLQSLDSNNNTDKIEITQEIFDKFNDNNKLIDDIDIDELLREKNIEKVSEENVKRHINNVLKEHGIKKDSEDNSKAIKVSNIFTKRGLNSSITITFNQDIKRFENQEIFQLKDESSQNVSFDLVYKFNKIDLILNKELS